MSKQATFAERIQQLLNIKGISKAELARQTGLSRSSITRYVKGDWEGKQDAVYNIAVAMDVSEAWLMGYDVPMDRVQPPEIPNTAAMSESKWKYTEAFRNYIITWIEQCEVKGSGLLETLATMRMPIAKLRDDFIAENPDSRAVMQKNFGPKSIATLVLELENTAPEYRDPCSVSARPRSYNDIDMDLYILVEKVIRLSPKERDALSAFISATQAAK